MELLSVTYEELLGMKVPLESIFAQKTTTKLAFQLLDLITEYQVELQKLEALRNKLQEQNSETYEEELLQFVRSNSVTVTKKLSKEELLNSNVTVSAADLWALRSVLF